MDHGGVRVAHHVVHHVGVGRERGVLPWEDHPQERRWSGTGVVHGVHEVHDDEVRGGRGGDFHVHVREVHGGHGGDGVHYD